MKRILTIAKQFFKELDKLLIFLCLSASAISCFSLFSLYKADLLKSNKLFYVQAIAILIGVVAAFVISRIDYNLMANLWKFYVPLSVALVVLTYFFGIGPDGADDKAWLDLGFTTIQPSEIMKLAFVFTFSLHLSKIGEKINTLKPFLLLCLHGMIPVGLVMIQQDFGSALVFLSIFVMLMFVAGLSLKLIFVGIVGMAAVLPMVWMYVIPDHKKIRFFVARQPENYLEGTMYGLQQYQGRMALGAGQVSGRGIPATGLQEVPAGHTDFIFSHIGQILGFVGAVVTLLILTAICVKILATAKAAKDNLGMFICTGVFAIFLFQSAINIGMILCVVPVIGITLPFISAGGTSVAVSYISIGMVLSVHRENKKVFMFD